MNFKDLVLWIGGGAPASEGGRPEIGPCAQSLMRRARQWRGAPPRIEAEAPSSKAVRETWRQGVAAGFATAMVRMLMQVRPPDRRMRKRPETGMFHAALRRAEMRSACSRTLERKAPDKPSRNAEFSGYF